MDLPIDYDSLLQVGSMMGSGGMIVMDEDTCMVDVAKFYLQFTNDESCGKCTTCRDGSEALLEVLSRITAGDGMEGDIEYLEELGLAIKDASMCGLGTTLPNPVLSTIKYFRDEYEAHIREKRCPAKVCKQLMAYFIDPNACKACLICKRDCPAESIYGEKNILHVIDQAKCTKCGNCFDVCPPRFNAVRKLSGEPVPLVEKGIVLDRKKSSTRNTHQDALIFWKQGCSPREEKTTANCMRHVRRIS
jgi:NADH-quinone oxidoreductase subunit F